MNSSITLARGEQLTLKDAFGQSIRLHAGRLWITQEGDAVDHIVEPGESFTVSAGGVTVVSALRAAGLSIEVLSRFDYFADSASAGRAAQGFGAHTVVMRGLKPR